MRVAKRAALVTDQPRPGNAGKIAVMSPQFTMRRRGGEKRTLHRRGRGGYAKDAKALERLRRHRVLCEASASSAVSGFCCALRARCRCHNVRGVSAFERSMLRTTFGWRAKRPVNQRSTAGPSEGP